MHSQKEKAQGCHRMPWRRCARNPSPGCQGARTPTSSRCLPRRRRGLQKKKIRRGDWERFLNLSLPKKFPWTIDVNMVPVSASCVAILNPDSLSSSKRRVNPGIRSWKSTDLNELAIRKPLIYFTKKLRAKTLQPGLQFDDFKTRLKSGIFKCIYWLSGSFFRGSWSGFSERGCQVQSIGTNVASWIANFFFCLHIYS